MPTIIPIPAFSDNYIGPTVPSPVADQRAIAWKSSF